MEEFQRYPTPAEVNKLHILKNAKKEISLLLSMSEKINQTTPLIYEEMYVVEHLQRIEEYFEALQDNLSEVRDYMVALLEWLLESNSTLDPSVKVMVPQLEKIIFLLREICPPDDDVDILIDADDTQQHPAVTTTATGVTPTPNGPPSSKNNHTQDQSMPAEASHNNSAAAASANQDESVRSNRQLMKETKSMEIRRQLEAKKAELLRIQQESEELIKKQQEERAEFDKLCEETRTKYAEFEEKIKTVERKLNKTVSTDYDLNNEVLFKKFNE